MRSAWLTAVVFLGAGVACSSNSGSGGSEFVQEFCGMIEPCCAAAGLSTSGQLCNQAASASASSSTYDSSAGQACLSAAQEEQANGTFCATLGGDIPACGQAFGQTSGTAQPGQDCQQDSDCAPEPGGSATCFDDISLIDGGTTQSSTCVQTKSGQAGDGPCIGTKEGSALLDSWSGNSPVPTQAVVCDEAGNLRCDITTQQCVELSPVGGPCDDDSACVTSAYCSFASTAGACTARLPDGAPCEFTPTACQTTSTCDSTSQTCKPLLADGVACTTGDQCQSATCVNGLCASAVAGFALALICGSP